MYKICLILLLAALLFAALAGCRQAEPTQVVGVEGQSDVDIMTENLLKAFTIMDYGGYLMAFEENAGKAISEDYFMQTAALIQQKVGTYIPGSKVLTETKPVGEVTDVTYKMQFSDEPDGVSVTVSIYTSGNYTYAAGIWFNSPKLFAH